MEEVGGSSPSWPTNVLPDQVRGLARDFVDGGLPADRRVIALGPPPERSESTSAIGWMDRIAKVATKRRLDEVDTSWVDYWRTRPVAERLAMATELSLECVGEHPDQGLRRVHRALRCT